MPFPLYQKHHHTVALYKATDSSFRSIARFQTRCFEVPKHETLSWVAENAVGDDDGV